MENNQIKYKIEETLHKMSIQRLDKKIALFNHIDVPLISIKYRKIPDKVSRKRLRLYLELLDTWYPLYRNADPTTKANFIVDIFKCVCTEEDLESLKSFKRITKKELITTKNDKITTIKRLRWRSREQVSKNIIHVQI